MPGADRVADLTLRWVRNAQADLAICRATSDLVGRYPASVAFHAQQAMEKAIKAILVFEQIDFPRTHDLERLAALVPSDWHLRLPAEDLGRMSQFAAETRYPIEDWNQVPEVTEAEAEHAIVAAAGVIDHVLDGLERRGLPRKSTSE